jgi:predicted alpha-1,2-mannosidase
MVLLQQRALRCFPRLETHYFYFNVEITVQEAVMTLHLSKRCLLVGALALFILSLTLFSAPGAWAHTANRTTPTKHAVAAVTNAASLVNPFIGTTSEPSSAGGSGDTFPGADAPFGMVQWSPDTVNKQAGGYDYTDNRIKGFSLTHLSGAGCGTYGDIPFMPYTGAVTNSPSSNASQYISTYSHSNEHASAGYYSVKLDNGVTTQLTTTQRSGAGSFTYPSGQTASLLLNVSGSNNGVIGSQATISDGDTISGMANSSGFCGPGNPYTVYFWAQFSQPFASTGTWNGGSVTGGSTSVSGTNVGAYVTFNTSNSTTITARVGLSFVSVANAQANVNQEDPAGTSFASVLAQSTQTWNNQLGEIAIGGGTNDQTTIFYTSLYHALLYPNIFSDDNGQYIGFDNQIYSVPSGHAQYANYSGWDIYRSEAQLLAFLAPSQASDIAQSMVNDYAQSGGLPKWSRANSENETMVGDPADAMLADIYAFGGTNFDTTTALKDMVQEATVANNIRPGLNYLESLGYLPVDGTYGCCNFYGPAATTLEYNSADFALGAFAQALGNTADYQEFVNRAQDWQNLLNTSDHTLEPRNANGSFAYQPFDPTSSNGWVEGSGAQYNWMVPFNLAGLFQAEGGNSAIISRLNSFFSQLNAGTNTAYAFVGNEPSVETPWEYDYAGEPYQAQNIVRQTQNTLYFNQAGGLPGNDDLGEMSSWYIWSALGMYPETPGLANMALNSPLFPSITVSRPGGQTITINAPNASASTFYIQNLSVNGATSNNDWLPPSFIANGGTLNFTLSTTANTSWASAAANEPPSYGSVSGGNGAGTYYKVVNRNSGQVLDITGGSTANGGAAIQWPYNGGANQQWLELPVNGGYTLVNRNSALVLDDPGYSAATGTALDQWTDTNSSNQGWNLVPTGDGYYYLVNQSSGLYADVSGASTANGASVIQWSSNGGTNQQWQLVAV